MMKGVYRAAVLGAGVMGARIAAHFANAGIPTLLLDMVPGQLADTEKKAGWALESPRVRNRIVQAGFDAALKSKPAAFFVPDGARLVTPGNFEDNMKALGEADWIVEAVAENLEIKRALLARVDAVRRPGSIVSTNTSGLPVNLIAEGRSEDFRKHWLGTHFFNPPRYLHLVELIPGRDTLPEVVEFVGDFADRRLGKGVVRAKDTPNFIANRIGTFSMVNVVRAMLQEGFTIEEVDALTGPALGLPKTATFRLLDLVGLDTVINVIRNIHQNAPGDEHRDVYCVRPFMEEMQKRGWLGDKAGQGFYKKVKTQGNEEILALDLAKMEYRPRQKPRFPVLEVAGNVDDPSERVRLLLNSDERGGRFAWKTMSEVFTYAANRVPEISDRIVEIDRAMQWGFAWEMGVFEMWDALGVGSTLARLEKEQRAVPENVRRMVSAGAPSFYRRQNGTRQYFDFGSATYRPVEQPAGVIVLAGAVRPEAPVSDAVRPEAPVSDEQARSPVIKKNAGASLIDLGDGVTCLEFHSKMNTIGADIISMLQFGLEETGRNHQAMVIANQGANFSAGANLMMILMGIQGEEWDELDLVIRQFQNANLALKYAPFPVVAAPFGLALGGGTEIPLHAARIQAHAELYMGLVEPGLGLVPAAGGTKEMVVRANELAAAGDDIFEPLKDLFEQTAMARVSTSAEDARRMHLLRPADGVSMNRGRLVADAKEKALEMVRGGYRQTPRGELRVPGEPGFTKMKLGIHLMREAGYITDHDATVAGKLAHVLCGGRLTGGNVSGTPRVSEQYLLDLEREAFLSLCGEKKTQERIAHTLKTGKPLRN